MAELTRESGVALGGWDPRYAVCLAAASHGDVGAVLVDSNGDRHHIELDQYVREDGVWLEQSSGCAGDAGCMSVPDRYVAWGTGPVGVAITIEPGWFRSTATAGPEGYWMVVGPADPDGDPHEPWSG